MKMKGKCGWEAYPVSGSAGVYSFQVLPVEMLKLLAAGRSKYNRVMFFYEEVNDHVW